MNIRMSIARCCCSVFLYVDTVRAWLTEGTFKYPNIPIVSHTGTMPNSSQDTFAPLTLPYEDNDVYVTTNATFTDNFNGGVQTSSLGSSGFSVKSNAYTGVLHSGDARISDKPSIVVRTNGSPLFITGGTTNRKRNWNYFMIPKVVIGTPTNITAETTITIAKMSPYQSSPTSPGWFAWSMVALGSSSVGESRTFGIDSDGFLKLGSASGSGYPIPSFPITISGANITPTFPFSLTVKRRRANAVDPATFDVYYNGTLTETSIILGTQISDSQAAWETFWSEGGWEAIVVPPHGSKTLAFTVPAMEVEVSSVEYKIEGGETLVTTPTFTAASPWSVSSGVIDCDNLLITTGDGQFTDYPYLNRTEFAEGTANLDGNMLHKIVYTCAAIDPPPVAPVNGVSRQPVVYINGEPMTAARDFDTNTYSLISRETESYFFVTNPSGVTDIKFYGTKEAKYTISDIKIYKIPTVP